MITVPKIAKVIVRQEGMTIQVLRDGKLILEMPYDAALEVSKAIYTQAKKGEEIAERETIITDQAILTRIGANFGLTSHPHLLKEATKEAAWNSKLRRYIPLGRAGGIKSQSIVGAPSLIMKGGKKNGL